MPCTNYESLYATSTVQKNLSAREARPIRSHFGSSYLDSQRTISWLRFLWTVSFNWGGWLTYGDSAGGIVAAERDDRLDAWRWFNAALMAGENKMTEMICK